MRGRIPIRGRVHPSVSSSVRPMLFLNDECGSFEGMSDDEEVASYVPPRYLFYTKMVCYPKKYVVLLFKCDYASLKEVSSVRRSFLPKLFSNDENPYLRPESHPKQFKKRVTIM